jgi:hypothetical protein
MFELWSGQPNFLHIASPSLWGPLNFSTADHSQAKIKKSSNRPEIEGILNSPDSSLKKDLMVRAFPKGEKMESVKVLIKTNTPDAYHEITDRA